MAELNGNGAQEQLTVRHRSRIAQIRIFFRKFPRMFVYQNDWKMLPMSALIFQLLFSGCLFSLPRGITITTTLGDLLDLAGREETKERIELVLFIGVFALLSTVTLEFIDKDKR